MNARTLSIVAILLWVVSAAGLGILFIKGQTSVDPDGRIAIELDPSERDLLLVEMRNFLISVNGIVAGLAEDEVNIEMVAAAARKSGKAVATSVPPALMAKLPMDFKQQGFAVHGAFDELAVAVEQGEDREMLLMRLNDQLTRCSACHAGYKAIPTAAK